MNKAVLIAAGVLTWVGGTYIGLNYSSIVRKTGGVTASTSIPPEKQFVTREESVATFEALAKTYDNQVDSEERFIGYTLVRKNLIKNAKYVLAYYLSTIRMLCTRLRFRSRDLRVGMRSFVMLLLRCIRSSHRV